MDAPVPPVSVQDEKDVPASPSVASTVPTAPEFAIFSAMLKLWEAVTTGVTSFISVILIVIVSAAEVLVPSETVTVYVYEVVVS